MAQTGIVNNQFKPEAEIYLFQGVPIDAMTNTFWGCFNTKEEQLEFYKTNYKFKHYENFTYQRKNGTVLLEDDADDLNQGGYNYMAYRNGQTGTRDKWIYCFVNSIGYVSDNVASVDFETDRIQTWRFEIEKQILPSFIAYEHRPQFYSENGTRRPCINTQPENIELGTDLVSSHQDLLFTDKENNIVFVIITMTSDLAGKDQLTHTVQGVPSQFNYYIFPVDIVTGDGGGYNRFTFYDKNGGAHEIELLTNVYNAIRSKESLVNKCVNITIVPHLSGLKVGTATRTITTASDNYRPVTVGGYNVLEAGYEPLNVMSKKTDLNDYETTQARNLLNFFPRYKNTKLYWYPFSYTMLSTNNGTNRMFKNELWKDPLNMQFMAIGTIGSSRVDYLPMDYKVYKQSANYSELINFDNSLEDGYELNLPVVSDNTAALMQSSRNAMNANVSNTIRSNETASAIASATGQAMSQQTALKNNLNQWTTARNNSLSNKLTALGNQQNTLNAYTGATQNVAGALAQAIGGDIAGGLIGAAGAGMNLANQLAANQFSTQRTHLQNSYSSQLARGQATAENMSTSISNNLRQLTTNYQNKTNLQNAIDTFNARIHDAKATADSVVSGSSDVFRCLGLGLQTPIFYSYRPTDEYIERVEAIFNARGYATNMYEKPNLHTNKYWNYIQTVDCNINPTGINPDDLDKIKAAFNNGITLWHTKDINNYSLNNASIIDETKVDKFGSIKD